jgi:RNA polymerase sigma-70 factor (ECF subfamily)
VLGFPASEVAGMLHSSVESVNGALKRARAGLHGRRCEPPPAPGSPAEQALTAAFVRAYESGDLDGLLALLTDDVFISMPPMPLEDQGREAAARFFAGIFDSGRRVELVPTRANGQPAFGAYLRDSSGLRPAAGFFALSLAGDRIRAFTRFETRVFAGFGLPPSLPLQ